MLRQMIREELSFFLSESTGDAFGGQSGHAQRMRDYSPQSSDVIAGMSSITPPPPAEQRTPDPITLADFGLDEADEDEDLNELT
jgi:hypothetical protein